MYLASIRRAIGALKRKLICHDEAEPWRRRQASLQLALAARQELGEPLVYLDVGSAGNPDPRWQHLIDSGHVRAILVDMVDDWSLKKHHRSTETTFVKAALGDRNGQAVAYITRHPACSSCLKPNADLLATYPVCTWFDVVREETVPLRRYEDLAIERKLPKPHIAKIDVQGFERQVIDGMGAVLDSLLCLEFECQLKTLYHGQATLFDLYPMLTNRGFILRDLKPQGSFEGEALEFNSFWYRVPRNAAERHVLRLWETVNNVWIAPDFTTLDVNQRQAYHFNG